MPDIFFATVEEIPEGLRDKAVSKDGKFKVGVVHESFRDNNLALKTQLEQTTTLIGAFKEKLGDDPTKVFDELSTLRAIKTKVDDGSLKGSDAINAEVEKRTKAVGENFQAQLQAAAGEKARETDRANGFENQFKDLVVVQGITSAVLDPANGANPAAIDDIIERGRRAFRVTKEGKLVRMDGDTMVYGASGETSETPKEWLAKVLKASPYLSKSSQGSGAADGEKGGGAFSGMTPAQRSKLSPAERLREARKEAASQ